MLGNKIETKEVPKSKVAAERSRLERNGYRIESAAVKGGTESDPDPTFILRYRRKE